MLTAWDDTVSVKAPSRSVELAASKMTRTVAQPAGEWKCCSARRVSASRSPRRVPVSSGASCLARIETASVRIASLSGQRR